MVPMTATIKQLPTYIIFTVFFISFVYFSLKATYFTIMLSLIMKEFIPFLNIRHFLTEIKNKTTVYNSTVIERSYQFNDRPILHYHIMQNSLYLFTPIYLPYICKTQHNKRLKIFLPFTVTLNVQTRLIRFTLHCYLIQNSSCNFFILIQTFN